VVVEEVVRAGGVMVRVGVTVETPLHAFENIVVVVMTVGSGVVVLFLPYEVLH
jgi:hypothetical protein